MSTEKVVRYTAEQMLKLSDNIVKYGGIDGRSLAADMLRQAARTESEVEGLVEVFKKLQGVAASFPFVDGYEDEWKWANEVQAEANAALARFQQ